MENNPKKSKALIITIIIIALFLLAGYFFFKNNGVTSTSSFINKIFSPLSPSTNSKGVKAQAGEDLNKGDRVYQASSDSNGNSIVMKVDNSGASSGKILGTTTQSIKNGDFGEIIFDTNGGSNGFLDSFSQYVSNLFSGSNNTITPIDNSTSCINNNATNYPLCTIGTDGQCLNNAINPPDCTNFDTSCPNGAINPPDCTNFNTSNTAGPDLTAGVVRPISTIINTTTTISSIISNNGDASTEKSFYTLFEVKKESDTVSSLSNGTDNTVSGSSFKNILAKIIKKFTLFSRADAAISPSKTFLPPTPNPVPTPTPSEFSLSVLIPIIGPGNGSLATVSYTFNSIGVYSIRACADKSASDDVGTITESNEDNNCGPWTTLTVTSSLPTPGNDTPECSDGVDNDGDGKIDELDSNCHLDGNLMKEYIPTHDSETESPVSPGVTPETTVYECNDKIDNDKDGLIDTLDPNCHTGGDLTKDYIPTHDSETTSPTENVVNKCLLIEQNPLTFTDAEKARLAVLLRQFYLISSTLRTNDDIVAIYNEIDQQKNFISQIDGLSKQCYLQTNDSSGFTDFCTRNPSQCTSDDKLNSNYNGPTKKDGNPWFTKASGGSFPYTNQDNGYVDYTNLEGNFNQSTPGSIKASQDEINRIANLYPTTPSGNHEAWILNNADGAYKNGIGPGCKVVSGYYYGNLTKDFSGGYTGESCDQFNTFKDYGNCYQMSTKIYGDNSGQPDNSILEAGCKWKDGVYMGDTERILNIW